MLYGGLGQLLDWGLLGLTLSDRLSPCTLRRSFAMGRVGLDSGEAAYRGGRRWPSTGHDVAQRGLKTAYSRSCIGELPVSSSGVELFGTVGNAACVHRSRLRQGVRSTKGHEMANKFTVLITDRLATMFVTRPVTLYFTSRWHRLTNISFVKPMSGVGQSCPVSGSSPTEPTF